MKLTYAQLRQWLNTELSDRENAAQEIIWLIEAYAGKRYADIDSQEEVTHLYYYKKAVERLKNHHPFQYVVGSQDFYGGVFIVNEAVLVPRFETELLVDMAVKWGRGKKLQALDLCTGSGCIIISLAKELNGTFLGTDISEKALAVAEKNNRLNQTEATFRYSDLFYHLPKEDTFDLITANPPYLTEKEMTEIPLEVSHEPYIALNGGFSGVYAIERILKEINDRLNDHGLFLMEIGENQGAQVLALAKKYGLNGAEIKKDLNQKDRILYWAK